MSEHKHRSRAHRYETVRLMMAAADYTGRDCDECAGEPCCVEIYDRETYSDNILERAFACGRKPTKLMAVIG